MRGSIIALTVAVLTLAAASVSQAAPVAPLPAGVDQGNLTHVQYWWHGRHWTHCGWWHHHHWHCW